MKKKYLKTLGLLSLGLILMASSCNKNDEKISESKTKTVETSTKTDVVDSTMIVDPTVTETNPVTPTTDSTVTETNPVTPTTKEDKKTTTESTVEEYTIKYVVDGVTTEKTLKKNENIFDYLPQKENYYFDGWYLNEDFTKRISSGYAKEDITVYGQFVQKLIYRESDNGKYYTISCYDTFDLSELVIPDNYRGRPVKEIEDRAFARKAITSAKLGNNIEKIGYQAFYSCENLTEVEIPSAKTIEYSAFGGCSSLKSVKLNNNNNLKEIMHHAFYKCTSLEEITLPDTVTFIDQSVFEGCSALKSAKLSNQIDVISARLFNKCISLESVTVSKNIKNVETYAFCDCVLLNNADFLENVEKIGSHAFDGCNAISSFNLGDKLEYVDSNAFAECASLTDISIPNSVEYVDYTAFSGIKNAIVENGATYLGNKENPYLVLIGVENDTLTSFTPNENTKIICSYAFVKCPLLTELNITKNVQFIGDNLFVDYFGYNNDRTAVLEKITVSADNKYYSSFDSNCIVDNRTNTLILASTSTVIPSTVTTIGQYAFANLGLVSVVVPNNITRIEDYAYAGNDNLTKITLSNNLTFIGNYVFWPLSNLIKISTEVEYTEYENCYYIGSENNPYMLLAGMKDKSLTSCKVHKDTKFIYSQAFHQSCLENIDLPEGLLIIGNTAFDCSGLHNVSIPSTITTVNTYMFNTKMECNKYDNGYYLGNKENPYLIFYDTLDGTNNSHITFHKDTKYVLFYSIDRGVRTIVLDKNIKYLAENVVASYCYLEKIYFTGTVTEFEAIEKDDTNYGFNHAKVYYYTQNGEEETSVGNWWYYDSNNKIVEKIVEEVKE